MKLRNVIVIAALCLPLGGCFSVKGEYMLYSPDMKVQKDTYDEGVRKHIASLERGPAVEGSECESAILGLIPLPPSFHIIPDIDKAYADAIGKAGNKYDALINVEVTNTQYLVPPPLLRVICWDVKGVAVKDAPYIKSEYHPQSTAIR